MENEKRKQTRYIQKIAAPNFKYDDAFSSLFFSAKLIFLIHKLKKPTFGMAVAVGFERDPSSCFCDLLDGDGFDSASIITV